MSKVLRAIGIVVLLLWAMLATASGHRTHASPVLQSGGPPVSHWPAEGNADDVEDGNDGTLHNGVTFTQGHIGQAFSLDGVDDYVEVPDNPNLYPGTGSFTVLAWIKTTAESATVVGLYEGGLQLIPNVTASLYRLRVETGKVQALIRDTDQGGDPTADGCQRLQGTRTVNDGQFHLVAMVRDQSTSEFLIYVDGQLDISEPLNAGATGSLQDDDGSADPLLIGAYRWSGQSTVYHHFPGAIDDAKFFDRAVTASEFWDMYAHAHVYAPLVFGWFSGHPQ